MKKPNFSGPGIVCHRSGLYSWSDGNRDVYFSKYTPDSKIINLCWSNLGSHAKNKLGHHNIYRVVNPSR